MHPSHLRSLWPALLLALLAYAPVQAATQKTDPATSSTLKPAAAILSDADSSPSKETMALLKELERRHGSDKTVHAEFKQIRHDESMDEDVVSSGTLWFKRDPEKFRCDYANPQPMITIINPEALYLYTREFNQVDFYQFDSPEEFRQQLDTLMLGFGFKAGDLAHRYAIESSESDAAPLAELKKEGLTPEKAALLVFIPKPAIQEQSPFKQLKVFIDKAGYLPEKIWYRDPQGNTMRIQLRKIDLGAPIEDRLFSPKQVFPSNAKIFNKRETNAQ